MIDDNIDEINAVIASYLMAEKYYDWQISFSGFKPAREPRGGFVGIWLATPYNKDSHRYFYQSVGVISVDSIRHESKEERFKEMLYETKEGKKRLLEILDKARS